MFWKKMNLIELYKTVLKKMMLVSTVLKIC